MEGDYEESIEIRRSGGQLTSDDGEYSFDAVAVEKRKRAKAHCEIFSNQPELQRSVRREVSAALNHSSEGREGLSKNGSQLCV
ncbi:hypothetical protein H6P81_015891 [Aristolochia fimbriata]|uniref:Uncharacterized protein n=1 Tax=Aristolochia fimbriata TaxID=158543 RepID=A0AAV7E9P9_ARIFI|nr:hypothetical protein H6P81_015891 [Aristolochia fimbriata]